MQLCPAGRDGVGAGVLLGIFCNGLHCRIMIGGEGREAIQGRVGIKKKRKNTPNTASDYAP